MPKDSAIKFKQIKVGDCFIYCDTEFMRIKDIRVLRDNSEFTANVVCVFEGKILSLTPIGTVDHLGRDTYVRRV